MHQYDLQKSINAGTSSSMENWYALRVKSRCEKVVSNIVQNKGFEHFLPLYSTRRRWSDRVKSVEFPLFPGYLFCRLHPEYRLPFLTIPGALHFVGIGRIPVPIDDGEIAAIQAAVRSGLFMEPWSFLKIGERVRLEDGPLVGLEGILVGTAKQHRLVVSVSLLKRSVAVTIERHWARSLDMTDHPVRGWTRSVEKLRSGSTVATSETLDRTQEILWARGKELSRTAGH